VKHARWIAFGGGAALLVAIDQISKWWATTSLPHDRVVPVLAGYFDLNYSRNPGAFFNLGAELGPWVRTSLFLTATLIAVTFITRMYYQSQPQQRLLRAALIALFAGALGNAIDRVIAGEVTDFLHLYWRGVFDWATFNAADAWITIGLLLMVIDMFLVRRPVALDTRKSVS
jgi:signal peptidase II